MICTGDSFGVANVVGRIKLELDMVAPFESWRVKLKRGNTPLLKLEEE